MNWRIVPPEPAWWYAGASERPENEKVFEATDEKTYGLSPELCTSAESWTESPES